MAATVNKHYHAIVDMGSNGVRFSITDLDPETARILPTVYQDRLAISLYKVQYSTTGQKLPIPQLIIDKIVTALLRFQVICNDYGVVPDHINVLATEATREALNSDQFRLEIINKTGWEVELLTKEREGVLGAFGIASSFYEMEGLVMDLGGGSTQLSWVIAEGGNVRTSEGGAVSLPYGAAALTKRLADAGEDKRQREELRLEIKNAVRRAYEDLHVPAEYKERAEQAGGFSLYLSGGGFRGWGYILMSDDPDQPYPIPIINGYQVIPKDFRDIESVQQVARKNDIFGVSKERHDQVPAVAFLIGILTATLPMIHEVRFCQGGIREGNLYESLALQTRGLHPLAVAANAYASPMAVELFKILQKALPEVDSEWDRFRDTSTTNLIAAVAGLLNHHQSLTKDTRAAAALRSTTTGILAGVHGIDHQERALLALILCERWGGKVGYLDDLFKDQLQSLVGSQQLAWARYVGRVAGLVGDSYPAGMYSKTEARITLFSCWKIKRTFQSKDSRVIYLRAILSVPPTTSEPSLMKWVKDIEKLGKEKKSSDHQELGPLGFTVETDVIHLDNHIGASDRTVII